MKFLRFLLFRVGRLRGFEGIEVVVIEKELFCLFFRNNFFFWIVFFKLFLNLFLGGLYMIFILLDLIYLFFS